MAPAAALVFLMTGPATNAATLAIIWNVLGKKTAVIYLLSVAACALAFGLLWDYVFPAAGLPRPYHHGGHAMIPGFVNIAGGVILLAVMAGAYLNKCTRLQR